ncbi:MAG: HigA family addiction module antitoxin [candidate division KSB1 bacterium]|nr:HigA family addiction module antitoxin [candidate division KSB1 bacterium]MDZ7302444.1 HigA family addiction module antitoxin [candidate division KSB1 bacterium]MDZ7311962.1 HigA family addiction module antitoxin [candidate division KSB1 bacterium]
MMIRHEVHSDLPIPPGEYLAEVIAELGMTKDELARRMNRPAAKLSAIFAGDKAITSDTALQLEKVVGVPAHIWTGLEAEYRLTLARLHGAREHQLLQEESKLITKFCYKELVELGFVAKKTKPTEKVSELQHFFGVTSLRNITGLKRYQAAFRCAPRKRSPEALAAWLRIGEVKGQKTVCAAFDVNKLEKTLPELRSLTLQPPEQFEPVLYKKLAETGVALVLAPHLPKTYAHGATFWLNRNKAVLMLTLRGSWADIFWFSLFHELGHILLHLSKQEVILESEEIEAENHAREREANQFAADTLIPPEAYKNFVKSGLFSRGDIQRFASRVGIDAGIVVGRLQHDDYIHKSWHNQLRSRYGWKEQK